MHGKARLLVLIVIPLALAAGLITAFGNPLLGQDNTAATTLTEAIPPAEPTEEPTPPADDDEVIPAAEDDPTESPTPKP